MRAPRQPMLLNQIVADVDVSIAGHLHPIEGLMLSALATQFPRPAQVVELGTLVGKSTVLIAAGLLNSHGGSLHTIDLFAIPAGGLPKPSTPDTLKGSSPERHANFSNDYKLGDLFAERSQLEVFQDNLAKTGVAGIVHTIQGDSAKSAERYADESIDMIFVDADHSYEGVTRDLEAWLPKVRRGGVIACHDHNEKNFPGVVRAIQEQLLDPGEVSGPTVVQSLFISHRRLA